MTRTGWMLDELSAAGDEHLDPDHVAIYDQKSANDPSDDVEVLRKLGLNDSTVQVDLGAGTFAVAIEPYCRRVVAVDVSLPMLPSLREKTVELGIDNVEVVQGWVVHGRVYLSDQTMLGAEPPSYTTETPSGLKSRLQPGSDA